MEMDPRSELAVQDKTGLARYRKDLLWSRVKHDVLFQEGLGTLKYLPGEASGGLEPYQSFTKYNSSNFYTCIGTMIGNVN